MGVQVGNDYTADELFKLLDIGIGDWRLVVVLFDFLGSKRLVAKVKLAKAQIQFLQILMVLMKV